MAEVVESKTQPTEFDDADQIIHAIHHGDVDAFVVMRADRGHPTRRRVRALPRTCATYERGSAYSWSGWSHPFRQ
jgi:hypothetical protein